MNLFSIKPVPFVMTMLFVLVAGTAMTFSFTSAEAARCSGLNQRACAAWKRGPQCKQ